MNHFESEPTNGEIERQNNEWQVYAHIEKVAECVGVIAKSKDVLVLPELFISFNYKQVDEFSDGTGSDQP